MATQGTKKTTAKKTEALAALEAEATGTKLKVNFRGEKLEIDPEVLDDYTLMEQLSQGMPFAALKALVPDSKQRDALLDTCDKAASGNAKLSSALEMVSELMGCLGAGK